MNLKWQGHHHPSRIVMTSEQTLDRGISDYLDGKTQLLPLCQCSLGVSPTPTIDEPLDFNVDERYRD